MVSPRISIDKTTYAQGDTVHWTGIGFTPNAAPPNGAFAGITTDNGTYLYDGPSVQTDALGNATGSFVVGTNIPTGPQKVGCYDFPTKTYGSYIQVTVTGPAPSPNFIATTDKTTYAQGEYIQWSVSGATGSSVGPCISTDNAASMLCSGSFPISNGQASGSFLVGTNVPVGPQKFAVHNDAGAWTPAIQVTITARPSGVNPKISINPSTMPTGSSFTISGSAFTPNGSVTYAEMTNANDTCVRGATTADASGNFTLPVTMACTVDGYVVAVDDSTGLVTPNVPFTIGGSPTQQFNVQIAVAGGQGQICIQTPSTGKNCTTTSETITTLQENATFTATPASGYQFDHFGGTEGTSTDNPFTVPITGDGYVNAYFTPITTPCTEGAVQNVVMCPGLLDVWQSRDHCVNGQWVHETQTCPTTTTYPPWLPAVGVGVAAATAIGLIGALIASRGGKSE